MAVENCSLGQKIIDFIRKVIDRIHKILENSEIHPDEAKALRENAEDLEAIVKLWDKAVTAAVKQQNARQAVKDGAQSKGDVDKV